MYMLNEWCWDKEKFPPPLFSFCLATLLLFLLQVISKKPAAVSISLSLSLSLRALFTLPLYGYRPHSVTCLLRFKHCGVWSPLCGCNLCHQTGQLTSKEWRRWGGGINMKRGKWIRLRMIEKEKTQDPVDEKHWLEKPERIHSVWGGGGGGGGGRGAVMAGVLNLYLLLMHAVSPPFGWNCEITRSLTAAGMLRPLVSALGQH